MFTSTEMWANRIGLVNHKLYLAYAKNQNVQSYAQSATLLGYGHNTSSRPCDKYNCSHGHL